MRSSVSSRLFVPRRMLHSWSHSTLDTRIDPYRFIARALSRYWFCGMVGEYWKLAQ
jgi:hypothetical protein